MRLSAQSRSTKKENEEIVVFGSEYLISIIEKCELGFFDGTFKTAPLGYTQILVFIVLNPETNVFTPIFYIFANSKSEDCYFLALTGIHTVLTKYGVKNKLKIVNVDFEQAIHNAFKRVFPGITLCGCYFHLVIHFFLIALIY